MYLCVYVCMHVCVCIHTADGEVCEHFLKVVVQLLALKSPEFVSKET